MDFRTKNQRQKLNNYNSLAEFPKPFSLAHYQDDNYQVQRNRQLPRDTSHIFQPYPKNKQNNSIYQQNLNQRFELLENRLAALQTTSYRSNTNNYPPRQNRNSTSIESSLNQQEHHMLRQMVLSDLAAQKDEIRTQYGKYQQLQMRQTRIEQDVRQWINTQRQQANFKTIGQTEQFRGQKKIEGQIQSVRSYLNDLQKKLQVQSQKKMKTESNLKQFMARQIAATKEQLHNQSRSQRQQIQQWTKDLRQSFQALKFMIETDRQNIKEAINQTQQSSKSSINKIHKILENINKTSIDRNDKIEKKTTSLKTQWKTFQTSLLQKLQENKTIMMNVESNTISRLEKEEGEVKTQNIQDLKEELQEWKKLNDQKNLNIFRQMTNAIKVMRIEWTKQSEQIQKQILQIQKSAKLSKKNITKLIKTQVQQLAGLMNDEFDLLTHEMQTINEVIATAKKQLEQKIQTNVKCRSQETKIYVDNANSQTLGKLQQTRQSISVLEKTITNLVEDKFNISNSQIKKIQSLTQSKFDQFIGNLNRQNQQGKSQINKSIANVKTTLTAKIDQNSISQTNKIKQVSQTLKINMSALNSQLSKQLNATNQNIKKIIQTKIQDQRSNNAKNISKTTNQIMAFVNQSNNKSKKQRQILDKSLKENQQISKKSLNTQIAALKTIFQSKIAQLKNKQTQIQKDRKLKQQQSKLKSIQFDKKITDGFGKIKIQLTSEITKNKTTLTQDLTKLKSQIDLKVKKLQQQKSKSQLQTKNKEAQIKAKDEQLKAKTAEVDKKISQNISKLKIQLQGQISKAKTLISQDTTKLKNQIEAKIKLLDEQKQKKQLQFNGKQQEIKKKQTQLTNRTIQAQKKIQLSLNNSKKQLQKLINDETSKLKSEIQVKMQGLNQQNNKKQSQNKAKQIQFDKNIEALLSNLKKQMNSQNGKDRKSITEQIQKLKQESKKIKIYINENLKPNLQALSKSTQQNSNNIVLGNTKIQSVIQQINNKINQLKGTIVTVSKSKQAQSLKDQDQKLQSLKTQLLKSIQNIKTKTQNQLFDASKSWTHFKQSFTQSIKQTKEALNKLQANNFTQNQKYKTMYDKLANDILDITDSISTVLVEMKPYK